jgi:hypothetical protein
MYNVVKDALFAPQNLLKYRNKSGLFAFFYLLVLAVLISLGDAVFFIGYQGNSVITSESTGCVITDVGFECLGTSYDANRKYALFGFSTYFLNPADELVSPEMERMVFQGTSLQIYSEGTLLSTIDLTTQLSGTLRFDTFISVFTSAMRVSILIFVFLSNVLMVVIVTLVGTLLFWRIKRYIPYRKIFRLVLFALAPFALLLTFYNLIYFNDVVFLILMFFAYRSVVVLQRVMTAETYLHLHELAQQGTDAAGNPTSIVPPSDEELVDPKEEDSHEEDADSKDSDDDGEN